MDFSSNKHLKHQGVLRHATYQSYAFQIPNRIMHRILLLVILQFLFTFTNGQGPGEKQTFYVFEEQPVGTSVGNLSVRPDSSYKFSTDVMHFIISSSGEIKTNVVLDREDPNVGNGFDLVVQNFPTTTHLIEVEINVLDMNDNSPEFPNPTTEISFSEIDQPGGSMKILDTATDADIGINDVTSIYRIVSGNEDNRFRLVMLNDTSTLLYLDQLVPLDREEKSSYRLNISAQDGGNPPRYGYLTADIIIQDFNDNPPIFDQSDYLVTVNETIPAETSIIQVTATDLDVGENAEITYTVIGPEQDQFWVEPRSGVLKTLKRLDCPRNCPTTGDSPLCQDNMKSCVVNVKATDNGQPHPQVGNCYVTVQLIDENDHDPTINLVGGNVYYVDESAHVNSTVNFFSVSDPDDGPNGEATVRIASGNERGHFKLGKFQSQSSFYFVSVAERLDRERVSIYNLTLEARDRGEPSRTGTVTQVIIINDVNDHSPRFLQNSYRAELSELVPIGSFVSSVTALDNDTGINAQITYSIVGNGNELGWFRINEATGLVTTQTRLDREQQTGLTLTILAQDRASPPKSSQVNLTIVIYDENDEAPTFDPDVIEHTITEGTLMVDRTIKTVTAIDHDQGVNGTVSYEFHSDVGVKYPGYFAIDSNSGRITLKKELDREEFASFELKIIARDSGSPSMSSTAMLLLSITDVNDNSPVFYPEDYVVSVHNQHPPIDILQLICRDLDFGDNARISYSLRSGDRFKFDVNSETGVISTRVPLSTSPARYSLEVSAQDAGGSAAVNTAKVTVYVLGDEEELVDFDLNQYEFTIREDNGRANPTIPRVVGQVSASNGFAATPQYTIIGGDPHGVFSIDANTGRISTASAIDRELFSSYTLQVGAMSNSQYAVTEVKVNVNDVNDNSPEYALDVVFLTVDENAPKGHPVYNAMAFDADIDENAALTYTATQDGGDIFHLDSTTGMLTLGLSMIGVEQDEFELRVTARDGGQPSYQATQTIHITVADVNDVTPMFEQPNHVLSLVENSQVNVRFFTLEAIDTDFGENGKIEYFISGGNIDECFGVFPNGEMFIASTLDRELRDLYVLSVTARDMGLPSRSSTTNVTIYILDANDNEPEFINETYDFSLIEESDFGTFVGIVSARDADIGQNSEVLFSLDGESHGFEINPQTGVLICGRKFDREQLMDDTGRDTIMLTAVVTDTGNIPRSSKATIMVKIEDANDHAPVFSKEVYDVDIMEGMPRDTPLIQVNAVDEDLGDNAAITYAIIDGNEDGRFEIAALTGEMRLSGEIDRESVDLYQLFVQASDNGREPLVSTTLVRVQVLDRNDNVPEFVAVDGSFTVSETAIRGHLITQLSATDADKDANAFMTFSIQANEHFAIDPRSGKLTLTNPLDYEEQELYNIIIEVNDNGVPALPSTVEIEISVADANDNPPVFNIVPTGEIVENEPPGTPVMTITASDVDLDSVINYEIIQQTPPGHHFEIEANTGLIKTAGDIDREFASRYHLTVIAWDAPAGTSPRHSVEQSVTIYINDENDNNPTFTSQNVAHIMKGSSVGSKFAVVTAEDPDFDGNGRVTYSITNGGDQFRINRDSGELFLESELQPRATFYEITVRAEDEGRRSSYFTMTVFVQEREPSGAMFTSPPYTAEVRENIADTNVITLSAEYPTPVQGANLEYYITSVTTQNGTVAPRLFEIRTRSESAIIRTLGPLDREAGYIKLNIEVFVVDKSGSQPHTRSVQVEVTVLDENDSSPTFSESLYTAQVAEDVNAGHVIITMEARDPDTRGDITYALESEGTDDKFNIDGQSGELSVVSPLDREQRSEYMLTVTASDGVHDTSTKVKVKVTDVNDESPIFTQHAYYFDVPENTETGVSVGHVTAIDGDLGDNAKVTYSILSHWGRNKFSLDMHTGVLQLIGDLNYEEISHYVLTIQAQDSGARRLSSTVSVYMNVIDENDNSPIFDPSSYTIEVSEDELVGASIMEVAATDSDSGLNSLIRYSLRTGDLRGVFHMDEVTGVLSLASTLDRETQSRYNLAVQARDHSSREAELLSATALISVTVKDVNDNAPVFNMPDTVYVRENSDSGTHIATLTVTDADEGENSVVQFRLKDPNDARFALSLDDGHLTLRQSLDRESRDTYNVVVLATDTGNPPLTTEHTLTVIVTDDNDFAPQFESDNYDLTVSEDEKIGTSLLTVSATDRDVGLNAELRYSITGGEAYHFFSMNSYTGELSIAHALDFELHQRHLLQITVQDLGQPVPKNDTATIMVTITDVNDCTPEFINMPYMANVMENIEDVPVFVTQVSARDQDGGQNGRVSYTLIGGGASIFEIDSTSGVIQVNSVLDRETTSSYELIVRATDQASRARERRSATSTVYVSVSDDNDHGPEFQHGQYRGVLAENSQAPQTVATVTATDRDAGANGHITYSLVDDGMGRFGIDPQSGQIHSLVPVDREEHAHYRLRVRATDSGLRAHSSEVQVLVDVQDVNDNMPIFQKHSYTFYIKDPTDFGEFVAGVTAVDEDEGINGQVQYTFPSDPDLDLDIDQSTGVIRASVRLERASGPDTYSFTVRATDRGENPTPQDAVVEVHFLSNRASDFPSIEISSANRVSETVSSDFPIATIVGSSTRPGSALSYHIVGGNIDDTFTIRNEQVQINKAPDYETTRSFELWIEVRDTGSGLTSPLSVYKRLSLEIQDANDNPPVFDEVYYSAAVQEGDSAQVSVIQVTASDVDSGENGRVSYELVDAGGKFSISAVGEIRTVTRLDREQVDNYHLVVRAVDNAHLQRSATVTVDIQVLDRNDKPPVFTAIFATKIPENARLGTEVLKITTTDQDIGINARHIYNFTSNPGNKFAINSQTGMITVAGALDREAQDEYNLRISANDNKYNPSTTWTVDILDANDNAPQFVQEEYSFSVAEEQEVGTIFGTVLATDNDAVGSNSDVFYYTKYPNHAFHIDSESGEVSLRKQVLYDAIARAQNLRRITVVASDRGDPMLTGEVTMTVEVKPANRYAPRFEKPDGYDFNVAENSQIGRSVGMVTASDEDFAESSEITYTVESGDASNYFNIDSQTGEIRVSQSVQGRRDQAFTMRVNAQDNGLPSKSSTVTVTLNILERNAYTPEFTGNRASAEISEEAHVNSTVATIMARDIDQGINGEVSFFISGGDPDDHFWIDASSGVIYVAQELNYEEKSVYALSILLKDNAPIPRQRSITFTVTLTDINDYPPTFDAEIIDAYVEENVDIGTTVITLDAADLDSAPNSVVRYSFVSEAPGSFDIDRNTGEITTKSPIDYEQNTEYSFVIKAENQGTDLFNTATVIVHVGSVNEYAPVFQQDRYTFDVSESANPGYVVGPVTATDADTGEDGVIMYYFVEDSNTEGFLIDAASGAITVEEQIDRESQADITLFVMAKNNGPIRGGDTSVCEVRIIVGDANDPPRFQRSFYEASVSEAAEPDTSVIRVEAEDSDVNENFRQFRYAIAAGNIDNVFKIDVTSGLISVRGSLNREAIDEYTLRVEATDSGSPPRTGSTTVQVTIGDVNDNGPFFIPEIPVGNLTEGQSPDSGDVAINLVEYTNDLDISPNQGQYRYTLTNYQDVFRVGATSGLVRARVVLNRERIQEYLVDVQVRDAGSPPITSDLQFKVQVLDINDNPSNTTALTMTVFAFQGRINNRRIADVHPRDTDLVGNYECTLVTSNEFFDIPSGCDLFASVNNNLATQTIQVRGNDGVHDDVQYGVTIRFEAFNQETIDSSIIIRIANTDVTEFLAGPLDTLVNAISNQLNVEAVIYNVHDERHHVDIFVAALENGRYLSQSAFRQRLLQVESSLEQAIGYSMQIDYNPCLDEPCLNNGECQFAIEREDEFMSAVSGDFIFSAPEIKQTVECICGEDYTGPFCGEPRNKCQENPCENQGTCNSIGDGLFECECLSGYQGDRCEEDINECLVDNPCENGATCLNKVGSYECRCPPLYNGRNCEYLYSSCENEDICQNGGQCRPTNAGYRCECDFGYRGQNCEIAPTGFEPASFASYNIRLDQTSNTIRFEFATVMENALLVYYPKDIGEFIALEIYNGQVRFSYALENAVTSPQVVRLTSPMRVSGGQWYAVEARRNNRVGSLKVSACPEDSFFCDTCVDNDVTCHVTGSGGTSSLLDSSNSRMYIGGVDSVSTLTRYQGHLQMADFIGCMRGLEIDARVIATLDPISSRGQVEGCPRVEDACLDNDVCGEGACVDSWFDQNCQCPAGKMGEACEEDEAPIGFGSNTVVTYTLSENYKGLLALGGARSRRKRQAPSDGYSLTLNFRTSQEEGLLFSATAHTSYLHITIEGGRLNCKTEAGSVTPDLSCNDGKWHELTVIQENGEISCSVDDKSARGPANPIPYGLWESMQLSGDSVPGVSGFEGCLEKLLINGEPLHMMGYSERYTITASGASEEGCAGPGGSAGTKDDDNPSTKIVVIVICTFFGIAIIAILSVILFIRLRRRFNEKKHAPVMTNTNGFTKTNGDIGNKTPHDSNRSKPDSGYGDDNGRSEEYIINQHIREEMNNRAFQEREVRASGTSLSSSRPDVIVQDEKSASRRASPDNELDTDPVGIDNIGYLEEPPEHYDLDNASSIAPSDVYDFAAHYKQYRKGPIPSKYKHPHKQLHQRMTPSPNSLLAAAKDRQSPASVSMQMARQSPASMLDRDSPNGMIIGRSSPLVKSQLTVENVNQLNRQTPVNQLSRASPAPNIPPPRGSNMGPTSHRSTPLSALPGMYQSNISSSSYSDRQSMPNGHHRGPGSRPNSKLKQPINQVGMRGTPTKGLTLEEVNRLNARNQIPFSTLDAISSSSEDLGKNEINRTDFTHNDLLDPAAHLPPDSSSEDETNDSFTCSEFESDHEKIRNDITPRSLFSKLPAVNEHEDTDTTIASRGRNNGLDTDSNRESHSTFFTASDDELPRRMGRTKLPNGALSLDYMLNWGPNYEKLVGVFSDISMLPHADGSISRSSAAASKTPSRPNSSNSNRPSSRLSQSQSPRPVIPPRQIDTSSQRVSSPKHAMQSSISSNSSRHHHNDSPHSASSPMPHKMAAASPVQMNGHAHAPPMVNGHSKQASLASLASSHDRQSSISSIQSSRSGRSSGKHLPISPLANGLNVTQNGGVPSHLLNGGPGVTSHNGGVPLISHSRSSSRSSTVSSRPSHNAMYTHGQNPYPPAPPHVLGTSHTPTPENVVPKREEYV